MNIYIQPDYSRVVGRLIYFSCNDKNFVVKTVSPRQFEKAHTIKDTLPRNTFVRLPVDEIEDPNALIYKHASEDLRQLAKRVKFSRWQAKRICHDVLQAIAELHDIDWMHGGSFQDNPARSPSLLDLEWLTMDGILRCRHQIRQRHG